MGWILADGYAQKAAKAVRTSERKQGESFRQTAIGEGVDQM